MNSDFLNSELKTLAKKRKDMTHPSQSAFDSNKIKHGYLRQK